MRHVKSLTLALCLLFLVPAAHAVSEATMKRVVGKTWYGVSVQPAKFTKSGKAYIQQKFHISFTNGRNFRGTAYTTFKLDGRSYHSTATIAGSVDPKNHTMTFHTVRRTREDRLPHGLYWCKSRGTLTVYKNKGYPGQFLLKGRTKDDCGGGANMELTTRKLW